LVTANEEASIIDAAQEDPTSKRQKKPLATKNDDFLW
jgi:hypothetical protein